MSEVYWSNRTQLNQIEMLLIFLLSTTTIIDYNRLLQTTEFFWARPVIDLGLIIVCALVFNRPGVAGAVL